MCCVAYAVLIGDLLAPLVSWAVPGVTIGDSEDWKRKVLIVVATSCVAPLGVLRSLNALRFTSAFCVISVTLLAVCIGYKSVTDGYGFDHTDSQDSDPTYHKHLKLWPESFGDILYATPIFFISYLCHFNVLSTHCEMKQPSLKRLSHVIHATTSVCTVLYVAVGVLGYLYREEGTCGDILDNFTNDDTLINVGRLALALTLGLSYPLLVLPCRDSFYRLVMMLKHDLSTPTMPDMSSPSFTRLQALEEENEENNHVARSQPLLEESTSIVMDARRLEMSLKLRAMVALCIVGTALIAACVLPGIVVVWSFMGSSVSVLIAFVFPSLMYLKVTWKRKMHLDRALSGILLVFSVLVMIGSTYEAVVNSMDKNADKCLKLSSD
jgi:amino acid permease